MAPPCPCWIKTRASFWNTNNSAVIPNTRQHGTHRTQTNWAAYAKALATICHKKTRSALKAPTHSSRSSIRASHLNAKAMSPTPVWSAKYAHKKLTHTTHESPMAATTSGHCATKTSSLETVNLLLNSVLATPTARFASFGISNFYLGTPNDRPEYARIKLSDIPDDFVQEYSLHDFAYNGHVYFKVTKGVYGLIQASKLAIDLLTQCLEMHGYYQCTTTPGLWQHKWRQVLFVLIVDDFGIQYSDRRHA
eukprot:CCRYP_019439-RA/>CCRYP_019439-RA protein AED:0.42 eAED:0.42 QI:0/0/0/1/0/0/2/0/249